jgi:hypothetical protein
LSRVIGVFYRKTLAHQAGNPRNFRPPLWLSLYLCNLNDHTYASSRQALRLHFPRAAFPTQPVKPRYGPSERRQGPGKDDS